MPLVFVMLWVIASTVAFLGCGYVIMKLLRYDPNEPAARLVIGGAIGMTLVVVWTACVGFVLGWHPWLWTVLIGAPVIAAFGVRAFWGDARDVVCAIGRWWRDANYLERTLFVFGVSMFAIFLVQATLPSTLTDDTKTYLYGPMLQLADGRLYTPDEDLFAQFGMNRQILSIVGTYIWDYRLARAINIPILGLIVGSVALVSRRVFSGAVSVQSLPVLIALPVIYGMAASGKLDHMFTAFVLVALLCIEYLPVTGWKGRSAVCIGAAFGVALGAKPTAVFGVPALMLWCVRAYLLTPTAERPSIGRIMRLFVMGALGVIAVTGIWIIRGYLESGSAVSFLVSTYAEKGQLRTASLWMTIPKNLVRALKTPWILTFSDMRNTTKIPPVFWLFVAIGAWKYRRNFGMWLLFAAGFGTILMVGYASASHEAFFRVRYMLPGFILLTTVAAAGLHCAIADITRWKTLRWIFGALAALIVIVPTLQNNRIGAMSAKVALGITSPDTYIDEYVGPAEVIRWSRDHWTWQDTVWTPNVVDFVYFHARIHHGARPTSPIGSRIRHASDPVTRCALMDSAHIKWALLGPNDTADGHLGRSLAESCMDTAFVSSDGKFGRYVVYRRRDRDNEHSRSGIDALPMDQQ